MPLKVAQHAKCVAENRCPTVEPEISGKKISCQNGNAAGYPCSNVDLYSFVPLAALGSAGDGNDVWGWTDAITHREYAIAGCTDGTSFVDVTDPLNPVVKGFLPTTTTKTIWRDMKVYKHYAYIVAESINHGMQVFDLHRLRNSPGFPVSNHTTGVIASVPIFKPDALYTEFGSAHNIVINEETGSVAAVGTKTCSGGLHLLSLADPLNPTFSGCFSDDGYTHDAQCVVYKGPDEKYTNQEICFCYNEDTLTIVNIQDKEKPVMISSIGYEGSQYTHQGWLNLKQTHLIMNDELDEVSTPELKGHTRSMVWDVRDLSAPKLVNSFYSPETSIDHNLYLDENYAYESNYCAGLQVLSVKNIHRGELDRVAYFDVAPDCSEVIFQGAWSVFPYFSSKTILVQSIERGLFVLKLSDNL